MGWAASSGGGVMAAEFTAPAPGAPVSFEADLVTYDRERRTIEATGGVRATQEGRVLTADRLVYDEATNRITASGSVRLVEASGEVYEASEFELTGDLQEGVARDLRAVFVDGAQITAKGAVREGGDVTTLSDATYTACLPCKDDPTAPPLWQVRAVTVRHKQEDRIIEFENAWLEVDGAPVLYVPYFYQPDPTVKRKTGLLFPTFGYQEELGGIAKIPFFWAISPDQDLTLTPWLMTNSAPLLEAQYRRAFQDGAVTANGSITESPFGEVGGHIFGEARYDIDDNWRAGLDAQRTLYRTYLREYNFGNERTLTSRLFAENFQGSNYFVANSFAFQNLDNNSNQENVPFVAPMLDYFYFGDTDSLGGRSQARLDAVALTRRSGTDTRRLSARGRWDRPFIGPNGEYITLTGALYADGYNVNDLDYRDNQTFSGNSGRVFPTGAVTMSLPLSRDGESFQQSVEPIVQLVASPEYGNSNKIPNEDSLDFEIETTNLFSIDPYPGLDRVFEGPRANYGVMWRGYGADDASASVVLGQTYQFTDSNDLAEGTGYGDQLSDYVTSIDIWPKEYLSLMYRNRIDHDDFSFKRNEVGGSVGTDALKLSGSYVQYSKQPEIDLNSSQQLKLELDGQVTRYWRAAIESISDVRGGSQRLTALTTTYEDECFVLGAQVFRRNTSDGNLEPTTGFFVRIGFKTLGEISPGYRVGG